MTYTIDESGWCFNCTGGTLIMPWHWGGVVTTEDFR